MLAEIKHRKSQIISIQTITGIPMTRDSILASHSCARRLPRMISISTSVSKTRSVSLMRALLCLGPQRSGVFGAVSDIGPVLPEPEQRRSQQVSRGPSLLCYGLRHNDDDNLGWPRRNIL